MMISDETAKLIRSDFEEAQWGQGRAVAEEWAHKTKKSIATVYAAARRVGFVSGRKKRVDAGSSKIGVTEEYLALIVKEINFSARKFGTTKKFPMIVESAMRSVAYNYGVYVDASVATVTRHLRQRNLNRDGIAEPPPHIDLRSLDPNHVHMADISVCLNWHFEERNSLFIIRPNSELHFNRIETIQRIKNKILRFVIIDHYSGAFYLKYFVAKGERPEHYIEFLYEAWAEKDDLFFPFCGIPKLLYTDKGSALGSSHVRNLLTALHVDFRTHEKGNPRAKGMVEGHMKIVQEHLECLTARNKPVSIDQLNEEAYNFSARYQSEKNHTRHKTSRFGMWSRIEDFQLRLPPERDEFFAIALRKPETRVVQRSRYISWNGANIYIGDFAPVKAVVEVSPDLWDERLLHIRYDGKMMDAVIPEYNEAGFRVDAPVIGEEYKSRPHPQNVRFVRKADALPDPESKPLHIEHDRKLVYKKPVGRRVAVEAPDPFVPRHTFFDYALKELGRPITPGENTLIKRNFPHSVPKSSFPVMLEFLRQHSKEVNE